MSGFELLLALFFAFIFGVLIGTQVMIWDCERRNHGSGLRSVTADRDRLLAQRETWIRTGEGPREGEA